jgi:hypothetical protein
MPCSISSIRFSNYFARLAAIFSFPHSFVVCMLSRHFLSRHFLSRHFLSSLGTEQDLRFDENGCTWRGTWDRQERERERGRTREGEREHERERENTREREREREQTYKRKEMRSGTFTNANTYFCVVLVCEENEMSRCVLNTHLSLSLSLSFFLSLSYDNNPSVFCVE